MSRTLHLRRLLDALVPADPAEAAHRDALLALSHAAGDPFSRDHWDPGHFTASAFVLAPEGTEVLLIHHGKLHRWLQPGGHVDPDDSDVIAAALREVAEETGLVEVDVVGDGLLDVDVHVIPARKGDPEHRHFDVRVLLRARTRTFAAGSDARDARWVSLDAVNAEESDESVLRAIRKIRAMAAGDGGRTHRTAPPGASHRF